MQTARAVRAVAFLEAAKGALALLVASGLFLLVHNDLRQLAISLVEHSQLNPASRSPEIFITLAGKLQDFGLWWVALGTLTYAVLRFVEAWGLYRCATWAEWLAVCSAAIYVPFEIAALMHGVDALSIGFLLVNLVVIAIMVAALRQRRRTPERPDRIE